MGSLIIGVAGLAVILIWDNYLAKKAKFFQIVQGPLVAVVLGILYYVVTKSNDTFAIEQTHLVSVPVPDDAASFINQFSFPNFSAITNPQIWITAFTIALGCQFGNATMRRSH